MFGMLRSKSKNQGQKARFYELLEKYKNGTITEAEAWELKRLLEEEKIKKEKKRPRHRGTPHRPHTHWDPPLARQQKRMKTPPRELNLTPQKQP